MVIATNVQISSLHSSIFVIVWGIFEWSRLFYRLFIFVLPLELQ